MTKSEAIHRRVLRCRPGHSDAYVTTHEALLAGVGSKTAHDGRKTQHEALVAEAEYLQQTGKPIQSDWVTLMFINLFGALVTSGIAAIAMIWWLS